MNNRLLKEALRIARERNTPSRHPEYGNFHHFSFGVQYNKILGFATNTSGVVKYGGFYTPLSKSHAEANVFSKIVGILDRDAPFELINIRLNKSSEMKLSKPCKCCYQFLLTMGCSKVWYSCNEGNFLCQIL